MSKVQVIILHNESESIEDIKHDKYVIDVEYDDVDEIVDKVDEFCDEYGMVDTHVYIISNDFTESEVNYLEDYWIYVYRTDTEVRPHLFAKIL